VPAPYQVWADRGGARLTRVPAGTAAFDAGVRAGALLVDVDAAAWWAQTGAAAHARALVAGLRLMAGEPGQRREFTAICPDGVRRRWVEEYATKPPSAEVSWHRLPSGAGYLRIDTWRLGQGQEDWFDAALRELRGGPGLVVDLRGNLGGATTTAFNLRDRFLRRPTRLGSVRVTTASGELAAPYDLIAEPAGQPWTGPVRFLTDPLTYSASEDVLLGLKGLDHVTIVGEPSGGGSGHTRTLRLTPDVDLVVSTALTYGRDGWCLDGSGAPVDQAVTVDRRRPDEIDRVLIAADSGW
jgi:carboxyl-terminal processing protease